ncbi:MAG: immune inhibitor A [Acidobacteriota bacterium]|nr:immune inhibitor A [Acidobacteriota bacterium]
MSAVCIVLMAALAFGQGNNGNSDGPTVLRNPDVSPPTYPRVIDVDLRDLPKRAKWSPGEAIKEVPKRVYKNAQETKPKGQVDKLMSAQGRAPQRVLSGPANNLNGQGYTGVNPPDTVGDVGKDYYIQSINGSGGAVYTIYNKSNGSVAAGPFSMDALGSGNCGSGLGDPIILYDELAERWMISEFSNSGNLMCVYVSQTSNPISGGWYNYSFAGNSFPDYPKYGIWPDAYYVGTNESTIGIYAFDRNAMLNGQAATSQRFSTSDLSGFGFQMIPPVDHSGTAAPPANSPGLFIRHRDTEVHSGLTDASNDYLEIFEFNVDWNNSNNSTLTGPTRIAISEIDSSLCGLTSFACIPQPGSSTTLDPLREVVMNTPTYRNMGGYEVIVGNLVTDVNGNDRAGIRWFELRNTGSGWTLYQEGTYSPDSVNRWMGAIAMDASGNIALGYNVSASSGTFPGLRYTGRLAGDTLGVMTQAETVIVNGSAANASNRYGDYAAMGVDPVDGCTFWFTSQYNVASQWSTRIASFSFDECGCTPTSAPTGVSATANGNNNIDVSWNSVAGATSYRIYRADGTGCPAGSYTQIGTSTTTSFSDGTVSGGISYAYVVTAYVDAENCESEQSACDAATATGACTTPPTFAGADAATNLQTAQCAIQVSWSAGTANCGTGVTYNVYRSTTSGFTPSGANAITSGETGLSYTDTTAQNATTYYYIVRAEDSSGNEDTNTNEVSGAASGPDAIGFSDDMESGSGNWTASGSGAGANWTLTTAQSNSPSNSFFANDAAGVSDRYLDSINVNLPAGAPALLQFFHFYNTESGFDGGVLEISTGGAYSDIGASNITENGYNSTISTSYSSPIGGRQAWSGNSGGFIRTTVDLSSYAGNSVSIRFRMASDSSVSATGWYVDDVTISAGSDCTTGGGPVCTYGISPASANFGDTGGNGSVTVSASDASCAWTATSNNGWITITSGASGTGNGTVNYSVAANTSTSSRNGSITIAGQTHSVSQAGAPPVGWTVLTSDDFESGWGNWNDGGSDVRRSANDSAYAHQGTFCVRLRDNSGAASAMSSDPFDATGYSQMRISFWYWARSMETNENFFVEFFNGSSWVVVADYVVNVDFSNNSFSNPTVTINSGSVNFAANSRFRIRCDASGNSDWIYVDEVVVEYQ